MYCLTLPPIAKKKKIKPLPKLLQVYLHYETPVQLVQRLLVRDLMKQVAVLASREHSVVDYMRMMSETVVASWGKGQGVANLETTQGA